MNASQVLKRIAGHKHSGSISVAAGALAAVVAWYLGDVGITGSPPQWIIMLIACAVTIVLNHITSDNDSSSD